MTSDVLRDPHTPQRTPHPPTPDGVTLCPSSPTAYGYVALGSDRHPAPSAQQIAEATDQLVRFCAAHGYTLVGLFIDRREITESGLYRMLQALRHGGASTVIVPDLDHLRHVGALADADSRTAMRYLRTRLLTFEPPPVSRSEDGQAVPDDRPRPRSAPRNQRQRQPTDIPA